MEPNTSIEEMLQRLKSNQQTSDIVRRNYSLNNKEAIPTIATDIEMFYDEDDLSPPLQSRYLPKVEENYKEVPESDSEQSDDLEYHQEDARKRIIDKLEQLKQQRNLLGKPERIQPQIQTKQPAPKLEKTKIAPSTPVIKNQPKRTIPQSPSAAIRPNTARPRRNDPVSLFQQRQNEWNRNKFLLNNKENGKEGRKLNLQAHFARGSPVAKQKSIHDYRQQAQYVAPHEKRRDDIRLEMRQKMRERPKSAYNNNL